ncbi:hypothetical protein ACWGIO_36090, partial [Streptomyces sp. NPDC054797]
HAPRRHLLRVTPTRGGHRMTTSGLTKDIEAPTLLGVLETIEDRSPLAGWALDRLGHLTSLFELSALTRGRVMHYAIPEQLKNDFGVSGTIPPKSRWTPPPATVR